MKKAPRGCARLSLVAGIDEISNFDLVRDLREVTDLLNANRNDSIPY
jgi:hypothetical protein